MTLQIKSNPYLETSYILAFINVTDQEGKPQLLRIKNFEHVHISDLDKITFCHVFSVMVKNGDVFVGASPVDNPTVHYLAKYEPIFDAVPKSYSDQGQPEFSELHTVSTYPSWVDVNKN